MHIRLTKLATAVAACLILAAAPVINASPSHAAGNFSLTNGHVFSAPPVIYPGLATTVSVGLGNTSNIAPANVTVSFGLVCLSHSFKITESAWQGDAVNFVIPADPSQPAGARELRRASATLTVPPTCSTTSTWAIPPSTDGYFWVRMDEPGRPSLTKQFPIYVGKPFTAANFRENLTILTKQNDPDYQAHHQLPQKYRNEFQSLGLQIDDPQYGLWWCSKSGVLTNHPSQAANYNAKWDEFFISNPDPTAESVLLYMTTVKTQFVYTC